MIKGSLEAILLNNRTERYINLKDATYMEHVMYIIVVEKHKKVRLLKGW